MTTWLHDQRLQAVYDAIEERHPRQILDLGCGTGDLLVRLVEDMSFERIVGIDLCPQTLARLSRRLDKRAQVGAPAVELVCASMLEAPRRYKGFDCALLVETIEHVDKVRLPALEQAVFIEARAARVIVTTPNAEFNDLLGVPRNRFRHPDHRFEWTRHEFRRWADGIARRTGYATTFSDIPGSHPKLGGASQMAVFDIEDAASNSTR